MEGRSHQAPEKDSGCDGVDENHLEYTQSQMRVEAHESVLVHAVYKEPVPVRLDIAVPQEHVLAAGEADHMHYTAVLLHLATDVCQVWAAAADRSDVWWVGWNTEGAAAILGYFARLLDGVMEG